MDDVRRSLLVEKQALSAETEQIRAKMDFQVICSKPVSTLNYFWPLDMAAA